MRCFLVTVLVYITTPDVKVARSLGRRLIEERLAACVNIFPIQSVYRWKGKVEEAEEVVLIAKTVEKKVRLIERRIVELHPYELPCIVWFKVGGYEPFLQWIREEVR